MELFLYSRLLDVIHCDKKLFLVFEYLNQDLKKYMDTAPPSGISLSLVKVFTQPNFASPFTTDFHKNQC